MSFNLCFFTIFLFEHTHTHTHTHTMGEIHQNRLKHAFKPGPTSDNDPFGSLTLIWPCIKIIL